MPTVLSLADFDLATRSSSGFLVRWIVPRVEPAQLFSLLARRLPFQLAAPQSDIIIGAGHGAVDTFTGQNEAIILQVGKYNPREVEGKIIKLLSCETAVGLGPDVIQNGAKAFMGYRDDYVWIMDANLASRPWADAMAASALMPVIDGLNALLDGATAKETFETEREGYLQNAEVEEDELIKACLEFNYENSVLLGDTQATVKARPRLFFPFQIFPPPPLILPLI